MSAFGSTSIAGEGLAVVVVTHLLADTALVDRVVELAIPRSPGVRGNRR
jgi:hypothetical protein